MTWVGYLLPGPNLWWQVASDLSAAQAQCLATPPCTGVYWNDADSVYKMLSGGALPAVVHYEQTVSGRVPGGGGSGVLVHYSMSKQSVLSAVRLVQPVSRLGVNAYTWQTGAERRSDMPVRPCR